MKRILALVMAVLLLVGCTACTTTATQTSDWDYIKEKGVMVVGITEYEPMNWEENGEWTGFDTEFAQAVGKELGVDIEFKVIDWDSKWTDLPSKKFDCVWNGMTLTDEAKANANCTDTYVYNAQVVVMKKDKLAQYQDAASLKGLKVGVESESAGMGAAEDAGLTVVEYDTQANALLAVESLKVDACVIDVTMANAMTGEGTSYADLGFGVTLTEEEYAIAFRKGSDVTAKVNAIMKDMKADGSLQALADKYELTLIK